MRASHAIWMALLACAAFAAERALANETVAQLERAERIEFQPQASEKFDLAFTLARAGNVTLAIYSGDGDLVRTVASARSLPAGRHVLSWDGRDDKGGLVPDEAYHPVLTCECGLAAPVVVDSRGTTGGEVIEKLRPDLAADGTIAFDLPKPARTLVRIGVKGGAMLRALDAWSPHAPGRTRIEWDGMDQSGVIRLLGTPGLTVLVTAFALPDHSIIVSGTKSGDYFAYRKQRGWPLPAADGRTGRLDRNGQRLSRQAQLPRSLLRDPRVTLSVEGELAQDESGAWLIGGPVTFKVDMPAEDKWLVQQSLYEVGFFLDHQFVSEEETGYTPLRWRWDPAGAASGEHTMTVNISGFWGQVGVASVRLRLK